MCSDCPDTAQTVDVASQVKETSALGQALDPSVSCERAVTPLSRYTAIDAPSGDVGPASGRDDRGRFRKGNTASLVTGSRSKAFWADVEAARRDAVARVLRDRGTADDASYGLLAAADGLVQAVFIRDSAWQRLQDVGGPMTEKDRERSAFKVWQAASDRVEKYVRLLGVDRVARDLEVSASEYLRQQGAAE